MSNRTSEWSEEAKDLASSLHNELKLNNRNWHRLKNNHDKRAAEMLSSALVQLLQGGEQREVDSLIEQSLKWLRREINSPACNH